VNVASRLESQGMPNRVHISRATWLLVRDRFDAEPRGPLRLRGLGAIQTYAVTGRGGSRPAQPQRGALTPVIAGAETLQPMS
jgi:class 3 adenylate cyclase